MKEEPERTLVESAAEMRIAIEQWIAEDARRSALAGLPGPTADADEELAVWLSLPDVSKAAVENRLLALNELRSSSERGAVSQLSAFLKTSRANIYRLMSRMSAVGPVTGLDTQRRAAGDPVAAREGFGPPMDGWLEEIVAADPEALLSSIRRQLQERMGEPSAPPGLTLPPQATLSRRVNRLKLAMSGNTAAQASICADLVIDHCFVNILIDPISADSEPREILALFAIDRPTGIVCAMSVFAYDVEQGLKDLIGDFADRTARLAMDGVRFASTMMEVTWYVPQRFAETAERTGAYVPASRRPRVTLQSRAKSGTALLKLMGGRLGPYRLRPTSNIVRDGSTEGSDRDVVHRVASLRDAAFVLGLEVDRRNAEVASSLWTIGSRGRPANNKAAKELWWDFIALFEPMLPVESGRPSWGRRRGTLLGGTERKQDLQHGVEVVEPR